MKTSNCDEYVSVLEMLLSWSKVKDAKWKKMNLSHQNLETAKFGKYFTIFKNDSFMQKIEKKMAVHIN